MTITLNIEGQVKQIKLSQNKALWPLFETIINSIQSLEETYSDVKEITVEAIRSNHHQQRLIETGQEEQSYFESFVVTDNGNGFTEVNFKSFQEAYSQLKVEKGCKGIGRFLWLKAFDKALISSTYTENGKWYMREFEFSLKGISPNAEPRELVGNNYTRLTRVTLSGFKQNYRESISYKTENLAKKIIEHCLPYFIMNACPRIMLKDSLDECICLNEYYRNTYKDSLNQDSMILKGREYKLFHMLLSEGTDKHELHLCANNREVKSIELSKRISNLEKSRRLPTESGNVFYVGYLAGDYLDEVINAERSDFEFHEFPLMGNDSPAGEDDIVDAAVELIKTYLHDDLQKVGEEKKKQIDGIVKSSKPQYRLLLDRKPEVYDEIPSGLSDDKIDLELYKHQQKWELEAKQQRADIEKKVKQDATSDEAFKLLFDRYCASITELNRASLAEYVMRRKAIIDLLEEALEIDEKDKYSKETRIHSIICPMQTTSDDIDFDDINLWLIDDRLAYHRFLASDKKMSSIPVLENENDERMDLAIFDAALSYASDSDDITSITVVELKRPMRNDLSSSDKDPITQVYEYVTAIKEGKVKKANGRGFGYVKDIAFYCYVIADITPSLKRNAKFMGLTPTQDGEGYFGYNQTVGTYIEVISFDKLLKNAKQRNNVLFDKLFNPKVKELEHPEQIGK